MKKKIIFSSILLLFFVSLFVIAQGPPAGVGQGSFSPGPPSTPGRGLSGQEDSALPEVSDNRDSEAKILEENGQRRIVNFTERPGPSHLEELIEEGVAVGRVFRVINSAVANVPEHAIENILRKPFVESVEEDYQVEVVLDKSVSQIEADKLHAEEYFGEGVLVAVMDTGINDHEDLNVYYRKDFIGEGDGDFHGHGTHVAGIIGSGNGIYKGVSEKVTLYDLKVLNKEGLGYVTDIIYALEWAVEEGVDVVNMSFGADVENCDGSDALSRAIDNAFKYGTLSVVSAGNYGPETGTISLPGCAREAITVGSVDSDSSLSSFSSRGPTADGRTKPDLVAPGEGITSTRTKSQFTDSTGTSMSTAHVTGAVSLLLERGTAYPEIKDILQKTADSLGQDENDQGAGEVNIYQASLLLEDLSEAIEEEAEEEIEEEIVELEEDKERIGRMRGVIGSLLQNLEEGAPQRDALEGVLERANEIEERVGQRMQKAQKRLTQVMERRRLNEQNRRLEAVKERIGGLLNFVGDNEEKSKAKSALEAVRERAEGLQNRIKERFFE